MYNYKQVYYRIMFIFNDSMVAWWVMRFILLDLWEICCLHLVTCRGTYNCYKYLVLFVQITRRHI